MKKTLKKIFGFFCEHLLFSIILIGIVGFIMSYWGITTLANLNNIGLIIFASISFEVGIIILVFAIIAFTLYIVSL